MTILNRGEIVKELTLRMKNSSADTLKRVSAVLGLSVIVLDEYDEFQVVNNEKLITKQNTTFVNISDSARDSARDNININGNIHGVINIKGNINNYVIITGTGNNYDDERSW